ncbi:MAG: tyrosine-type recombinase/integrase [Acidobacteriota bacterium]
MANLTNHRSTYGSSDSLEKWRRDLLYISRVAPSTARQYVHAVRRLERQASAPAVEVDRAGLARHMAWLDRKGYATSTQRQAVAALRTFYSWAELEGLVDRSPAWRLRGPRARRREAAHLTREEVARLLYGREPGMIPASPWAARDRVLLGVGYYCGARAGEVGRIQVRDLLPTNTGGWSVAVPGVKGGDVVRRVVLDPLVCAQIQGYLVLRDEIVSPGPWLFPSRRRRPLSADAARGVFEKAWREAGIRKRGRRLTWHVLRHSVATHLVDDGASVPDVQRWLRHRDMSSTQVYAHAREEATLARGLFGRRRLDTSRRPVGLVEEIGHLLASASGASTLVNTHSQA